MERVCCYFWESRGSLEEEVRRRRPDPVEERVWGYGVSPRRKYTIW